jgi:hypothetical protein
MLFFCVCFCVVTDISVHVGSGKAIKAFADSSPDVSNKKKVSLTKGAKKQKLDHVRGKRSTSDSSSSSSLAAPHSPGKFFVEIFVRSKLVFKNQNGVT